MTTWIRRVAIAGQQHRLPVITCPNGTRQDLVHPSQQLALIKAGLLLLVEQFDQQRVAVYMCHRVSETRQHRRASSHARGLGVMAHVARLLPQRPQWPPPPPPEPPPLEPPDPEPDPGALLPAELLREGLLLAGLVSAGSPRNSANGKARCRRGGIRKFCRRVAVMNRSRPLSVVATLNFLARSSDA